MSSKSSFSAFKDVDESVAKPVLGSDGAARWQDFRGSAGKKLPASSGVAPAIPLKKLDRALGTKSIRDERATEARVRREAGDREAGSGYTDFKRKSDHEEAAERKRKKLVLERVRPDDVPYFLDAEAFEGYKFDYVFTTRDTRGIGYYWDGTDSLRKEMGLPPIHAEGEDADKGGDSADATKKEKRKKKKKRKKEPVEAIPESVDEFNPMEQVAQAMMRREQAMNALPTSTAADATNALADAAALGASSNALKLTSSAATTETTLEPELFAAGWESTSDPTSGKTYYFRRSTNERSWTKPSLPKNTTGGNGAMLPVGWKIAKDPTGKVYYYHTSGKTSWEKPPS